MISVSKLQQVLNEFHVKGDQFIKSPWGAPREGSLKQLLVSEKKAEEILTTSVKDVQVPKHVAQAMQKTLKALVSVKEETEKATAVIVALEAIEELQKVLQEMVFSNESPLKDIKVHPIDPSAGG